MAELAEGERVEIVVRPESLRLATSETGGALPGRAVEHRFTGPLTYCIVRLLGGEEIEVLVDGQVPAVHEEVFVAPRQEGPKPRIFRLEGEEPQSGSLGGIERGDRREADEEA